MNKRLLSWCILALMTLFAVAAFAADINGKWKGEVTTPSGEKRETVFTLKAEGDKLTGTVSGGRGGDAEIQDGKVSGDEVSFSVVRKFQDREFKINYKGKVVGDELMLNVEAGQGRTYDLTAKRVPVS